MKVSVPAAALLLVSGLAALAQEIRAFQVPSFEEFSRKAAPGLVQHLDASAISRTSRDILLSDPALLAAPKRPFVRPLTKLPDDDPRVASYSRQLIEFLERRQQLQQLTDQYRMAVGAKNRLELLSGNNQLGRSAYFASKISKWNGEIFWAPASKESDINLRYADEVRAVFGPIPPFDVTTIGKFTRPDGSVIETRSTYVEVDGNRAELKPNTSKPGAPLEYEHRDVRGDFVKWTPTIEKCDKPSLAGGVTPCGTASRISRIEKGNVEWIALARKTRGPEILKAERYWSQDDPSYALLGYISFNSKTGEMAFFDGTYEGMQFNWNAPTIQPGGAGYSDEQGRVLASRTYDSTFRIDCAACHDNKEPRIITPYIKQARVGYRDDARSAAFSLGDLLPERTRNARTPYRVVGSSYTAIHKATIDGSRVVFDPARNCTSCHGLTNGGTGRFASDAVARLGSLGEDDGVENSFRTEWALRTGAGKIHPWMNRQPQGNDLKDDPPPPMITDADWDKLRKVIEDPDSDPRSLKTYTDAPAPESVMADSTRVADPSGPQNFAIAVDDNPDGQAELAAKRVRVAWTYLNALGGVPERDDVRFNVAILETGIPQDGADPRSDEFPTIEQAKALGSGDLGGSVYTDGRILVVKDMSFAGHKRWTDPAPTGMPRDYKLDFPAVKNRRYLVRVVAKRFGFDQGGERFSSADHLFSIDIR